MKSKFFIIALAATMLLACQPTHYEGFDTKLAWHRTERCQNTADMDYYVMDLDNAFVGKWQKIDVMGTGDSRIITISEEEIWVPYQGPTLYWVIDENNIRVRRLFLDERNVAYEDTCQFWFNHDTLTITSILLSMSAIYPPEFGDVKLIRIPK